MAPASGIGEGHRWGYTGCAGAAMDEGGGRPATTRTRVGDMGRPLRCAAPGDASALACVRERGAAQAHTPGCGTEHRLVIGLPLSGIPVQAGKSRRAEGMPSDAVPFGA